MVWHSWPPLGFSGAAAGEGEGGKGSRRERRSGTEERTCQGGEEVLTFHWWGISWPSRKHRNTVPSRGECLRAQLPGNELAGLIERALN